MIGDQVVLSRPELAYLLDLVAAGPVVGLDNRRLAEADRTEGLEVLKAEGRLVPDGAGFDLDDRLALLIAVMANPEMTTMVTRHDAGHRVATLAEADGLLVEHYRTADDRYVVTKVPGADVAAARLESALDGVATADDETSVVVPVDGLSAALTAEIPAARSAAVREVMEAGGAPAAVAEHWGGVLVPGQALVTAEVVAVRGGRPLARRDVLCFGSPGVLVSGRQAPGEELVVEWFRPRRFATRLERTWGALATAARRGRTLG